MDILKIARDILDCNQSAVITGSLMLKIRGIDIGREPHDIDILLDDYAANFIFPVNYSVNEDCEKAESRGAFSRVYIDTVKIDIISSSEPFDVIDGYRVASVEFLVKAKMRYAREPGEGSQKHFNDLLRMGYGIDRINQMNEQLDF